MVCGGDVKWFHTICCIWEWCDCCRHSKPGLIVVCSIKIKATWAISVQKFSLMISSRLEKRAEFGKCWQALQKSVLVYVAGEMGCIWMWFMSAIGFYYVLFMFGVTVVKNGHVAWGVEKHSKNMLAAPPQLVAIRVREPANQLRYRGSLGENLAILWLVSTGDGIAARTNELRWNHITLGQHIFKLEG